MKHVSFLLMIMLLAGGFFSCTMESTEDDPAPKKTSVLKGKKYVKTEITEKQESTPESENGITPYIIPGDNTGGNRTCAEVEEAWDLEEGYFMCGEKIDYAGDGMWEGEFPDGLEVTVDDEAKRLAFTMDECITIDGKSYKVGAVIVKGGPVANVYYYENGTLGDSNLGAPQDGRFLVSNLTFCFVECEEQQEDLTIALKGWYFLEGVGSNLGLALSTGDYPFSEINNWCGLLGIQNYPTTSVFDIQDYPSQNIIGTVSIEEDYPGGVHSLVVTVDLNNNDLLWDHTYLYVGSLTGLTEGSLLGNGCPSYTGWDFQDESDQNTHIYTIPFEELN